MGKENHSKFKQIRLGILVFFLVLFSIFSMRHFIFGGSIAASVDALCPFGGFETLLTFITSGGFVPRILMSSPILAAGVLITVIILNRGFCGYICPFGAVQELLNKIPTKKIKLPKFIENNAIYIKYFILAVLVFGTWKAGTLIFRGIDPFANFFHFGKGIIWNYSAEEFTENILGFSLTIIILGFSIFIDRFWCKYLCPLGAVTAITSKISFLKINRDKKTCIDCKLCDKACPMSCEISTPDKVDDIECISCHKCIDVCPKKSLELKIFNNKKISKNNYAIALLVLFFTIIFAAKAIGIWQSVPNMDTALLNVEGKFDPELIKGWMTLQEVATESGININHFYQDLNLPLDLDPNTPLRDLTEVLGYEFHASNVKEYVTNFQHNPLHHTEDIQIPERACPWNLENDPYPGACGLYEDKDGNGICDLSE